MPNFTDIQNALIAALTNAKVYIDAQDASVKAYADSKIEALMNTSDLTAKLALLVEINGILDGDNATAGFQAWQNEVVKLAGVVADFDAFKLSNAAALDAITADIDAISVFVDGVQTSMEQKIIDAVEGLDSSATTNNAALVESFASMQIKAATLFAVA